jgi:ribonuclease T1
VKARNGVRKVTPEGPKLFMARVAAFKLALTSVLFAASLVGTAPAFAKGLTDSPIDGTAATIRWHELPRQGRETYELIRQGGPFPYEKDGSVFFNRERLLPAGKRGYWREYTVKTPGSRDRGARRIVCGGPPRDPHACYYTADHYASFRMIVENPK